MEALEWSVTYIHTCVCCNLPGVLRQYILYTFVLSSIILSKVYSWDP
jgi:hypothetical protein